LSRYYHGQVACNCSVLIVFTRKNFVNCQSKCPAVIFTGISNTKRCLHSQPFFERYAKQVTCTTRQSVVLSTTCWGGVVGWVLVLWLVFWGWVVVLQLSALELSFIQVTRSCCLPVTASRNRNKQHFGLLHFEFTNLDVLRLKEGNYVCLLHRGPAQALLALQHPPKTREDNTFSHLSLTDSL